MCSGLSLSVMSDSLWTSWTAACQAPLSMEFSRQYYWSGLPFPSPGDLLNPGIKLGSPTLQAEFLLPELSIYFPNKCRIMALRQGYFHSRFVQIQFSSAVSNSLWPHGLQHTRPPCPSPTPGAHSNSCPSSQWCHPTISAFVVPFSSCL